MLRTFNKKIASLVARLMKSDFKDYATVLSRTAAEDLAIVAANLPYESRVKIYESIYEIRKKIQFLMHANQSTRVAIFKSLSDQEIKKILELVSIDYAVEMIEDISDRRSKAILNILSRTKIKEILEIQRHSKNTAARMMSTDFFLFSSNQQLIKILEIIKNKPGIPLYDSILICTKNRKLVGKISIRDILFNKDKYSTAQDILDRDVHYVTQNATREEVISLSERFGLVYVPVVGDDNRVCGVINSNVLIEASEDIADSTIASIVGAAENVWDEEYILYKVFYRIPWLIITMFVGLITANTLSLFQNNSWFLVIPLFVPLINGLSGNVGIQCSTVLVRSFGSDLISSPFQTIVKEMSVALTIGLILGIFAGSLTILGGLFFGLYQNKVIFVGVTVAFGLFSACCIASILGLTLPWFFERIGIDPAISSGPVVTAFNDLFSTMTFLFVAKVLYHIFID